MIKEVQYKSKCCEVHACDDWIKKRRIGVIIAICVALIGVILLASGEMGSGILGLLMLLAGGPYAIFSIKDLIKH